MSEMLLVEVLRALDVAVIERLPDATYRILGQSPDWLDDAFDAAPPGSRHTLAGALPFLDQFLQQADAAWHRGGGARANSGPFAAGLGKDESLVRATALTIDGRALLVLERLTGEADTRPILQKAREQTLAAEQLTRKASAVHAPAADISRLVGELVSADLPAAARGLVDSLHAASAELESVAAGLPKPPPKGRRFASTPR